MCNVFVLKADINVYVRRWELSFRTSHISGDVMICDALQGRYSVMRTMIASTSPMNKTAVSFYYAFCKLDQLTE